MSTVQLSNIEADFLSDLVINCETPNEVYTFTEFLSQTISVKMGDYQKQIKLIQEKFTKYVEQEAPLYLKKEEGSHDYAKDSAGNPVAIEGKEEDWKNIFQGAHSRMNEEMNALGNTVETYSCDEKLMDSFINFFQNMNLKNVISIQKDTAGVNRVYLMIYLVTKRFINATKA